ncbi:hypothetical protein AAFX24_27815 [Vibrio mediterranei]|uniref:hypothetical protein n=1 Tax=Vibrio mediterranei TaxID=689 RepID=UPI0038CF286B
MEITGIAFDREFSISKHDTAGYRIVFICPDSQTIKESIERCLKALNVLSFDIDCSRNNFIFVTINDGQYKGFYDADYFPATSELLLIEDRG